MRPLYAGLDGELTFDRVGRLRSTIEAIRDEGELDPTLLELLLLFHGAVDRLGSVKRDSRLELFLRGLGLPGELIQRLGRGLGRHRESPQTREEDLLHDALLLERTGTGSVVRALMYAGRKRRPMDRAMAALDPGAVPERFRTAGARRLAETRRQETEAWLTDLRRRLAEESGS